MCNYSGFICKATSQNSNLVGRLRKSNRFFVSFENGGAETADLLLRFGRELIACSVLSYDMRFSVFPLLHVVLRILRVA